MKNNYYPSFTLIVVFITIVELLPEASVTEIVDWELLLVTTPIDEWILAVPSITPLIFSVFIIPTKLASTFFLEIEEIV